MTESTYWHHEDYLMFLAHCGSASAARDRMIFHLDEYNRRPRLLTRLYDWFFG